MSKLSEWLNPGGPQTFGPATQGQAEARISDYLSQLTGEEGQAEKLAAQKGEDEMAARGFLGGGLSAQRSQELVGQTAGQFEQMRQAAISNSLDELNAENRDKQNQENMRSLSAGWRALF